MNSDGSSGIREREANKRGTENNQITLRKVICTTRRALKFHPINPIKAALTAVRAAVKIIEGPKHVRPSRVLSVPKKIGGTLPFLILLFAGLSVIGASAGRVAGVGKAVSDARPANAQLKEKKRHNKTMEAMALSNRLHLMTYKQGLRV